MNVSYKYYKNSNTGAMVMRQIFEGYSFEIPDHFYGLDKQGIEMPDLTGFVEISEKKFMKCRDKLSKNKLK